MSLIPDPSLVVLVGPSGSGKSTWAAAHFRPEEVISSDRLRAIVGSGEHDLDASSDAFSILDQMVDARLRRRLLTVVDTLGFDEDRRRRHLALARELNVPAVMVVFDSPEAQCRERNRQRSRPVPASVLTSQFRRMRQIRPDLAQEGWDLRVAEGQAEIRVGPAATSARQAASERPQGLRFVLHLSRFVGPGDLGTRLSSIAEAAEAAGFYGISVMDHLTQIPQVGREWEDFPEAFSALSFLAGRTANLRLGALVTPVGLRNPALLAKIVATIDVMSNGRAFCGLGAGWYEAEQVAYGYEFDPPGRRLDRLEDTLRILPLMWGAGKATYQGKVHSVSGAVSYPRPVGRIPIIVGGRGSRTIRLAGAYADGLNIVGSSRIAETLAMLRKGATDEGRDPESVELSILDTPLLGKNRSQVAALVEANRGRLAASAFAARHHAGTAADQIERLRTLAAHGVGMVFLSPVGLTSEDGVAAWKPVIEGVA